MKNKKALHTSAAVCALCATGVSASTWDESIQGDLSNDRMAPSALSLDAGTNIVTGGFGAPDLDYLTVIVPAGYALAAIVTGIHTNPGLSKSFIGVQAGTVMTVPPNAPTAAGLLGWTHFRGQDGVDLLPAMAVPSFGSTGFTPPLAALPAMAVPSFGSTGFTPPLAAGPYTFWFNETLSDPGLTFDFEFRVDPVPAQDVPLPAVAWLLGAGIIALTGAARARRNVRA